MVIVISIQLFDLSLIGRIAVIVTEMSVTNTINVTVVVLFVRGLLLNLKIIIGPL